MRQLLRVTTPEEKAPVYKFARARIESGKRVVIGTLQVLHVGAPIGKAGDKFLVVKCRSTREDFLKHAPESANTDTVEGMPFYWELELAD